MKSKHTPHPTFYFYSSKPNVSVLTIWRRLPLPEPDSCAETEKVTIARLYVVGRGRTTAIRYATNDEQKIEGFLAAASSVTGARVVVRNVRTRRWLEKHPELESALASVQGDPALETGLHWGSGKVRYIPQENRVITVRAVQAPKVHSVQVASVQVPVTVQPTVQADSEQPLSVLKQPNTTEIPVVDPSPRHASSGPSIVFTVFSTSTTDIASTVQLNQLLQALPAGPSFVPDQVGDYTAASLHLEQSNTEGVEGMLAASMTLKDNGFRFIVNEEAEAWLDGLLEEFDENDVAVVREVWVRQT